MGEKMNHDAFRRASKLLEERTGADSVETIERVYAVPDWSIDDGVPREIYACVFPHCSMRRKDPVAMWLHVHFGAHGRSFSQAEVDRAFREVQASYVVIQVMYGPFPSGVTFADPAISRLHSNIADLAHDADLPEGCDAATSARIVPTSDPW